ncbi:MAG: M48 family metallopeptidase [Alphaproteobacteria bacterium]|nr:M48 family metallopeptidase [Alphaproteobacteria bacterium]
MRLKDIFYTAASPAVAVTTFDYLTTSDVVQLSAIVGLGLAFNLFSMHQAQKKNALPDKSKNIRDKSLPYYDVDLSKLSELRKKWQILKNELPDDVELYVSDNRKANGFAFNRGIYLTTPLINELDMDKLEYVIRHEYSHIKNNDTYLLSVPFSLNAGCLILSFNPYLSGQGMLYLTYLAACFSGVFLTNPWLSRRFEYRADQEALQGSENLKSAVSALKKIHSINSVHDIFSGKVNSKTSSTFSTHPTLKERVNNLKRQFC